MEKIVNWFGWKLNAMFPNRSRLIEVDGEPYLRRFYIKRSGRFPGIYLHYFYRGDADRDLHNHPWDISISLILAGGYAEERLHRIWTKQGWRNTVVTRLLRPWNINIIKANDFHRVDFIPGVKGTWTLFCSGKRVQDWGFYIKDTGKFIDNQTYENIKDLAAKPVVDMSLQFDVN